MNGSHPVRRSLVASICSIVIALSSVAVGANPVAGNAQHFALYVTSHVGRAYQSIDPMSLTDLDDDGALRFDYDWPQLAISADGSTFVTISPSQGPLDQRITVRDGIGGAVRQAITPAEAVYNPRLSADGSRLVAEPSVVCGPIGCGERTWFTWDTRTGELLAATRADLGAPVWPDLVDTGGRRLYYPFHQQPSVLTSTSTPEPGEPSAVGPWPLQIASYDLTTGQETARATVPGVSAGSWQAEPIDVMYVGQMELPAVALSPDGSRLAVVDAALETLTLLDAGTLAVLETHAVHRPEGLTDRLLGWLGLGPQSARAKASEGRALGATWSIDGQFLYLTGHETEVGETIDDITGHGLGISKIEVATGEITAVALEGHDANVIIPAPDGQSLYILMPETPWWENGGGSAYVLRRLDADSLETMAERRLDAWHQIMLVPLSDT